METPHQKKEEDHFEGNQGSPHPKNKWMSTTNVLSNSRSPKKEAFPKIEEEDKNETPRLADPVKINRAKHDDAEIADIPNEKPNMSPVVIPKISINSSRQVQRAISMTSVIPAHIRLLEKANILMKKQ